MRPPRTASWWFVSDLHLDPDGPDPDGVEPAFASFVDGVVRRGNLDDRNLVLLGDTLELRRHDGRGSPPDRVCGAARTFPGVFGALRGALADGISVHIVCGNHDYALAGPACRTTLAQLLREGPVTGSRPTRHAGRLLVHPWILHRPGLFYAEHGNQHHELNRLPELVAAAVAPSGEWLPETVLETWSRGRTNGAGPLVRARDVLVALAASVRSERTASHDGHQALVDGLTVLQQLPPSLLRDLHAVGATSPVVALTRTSRRVTLRAFGRRDHDSYLRHAAASVDAILRPAGRAVPAYIFGHSHVEALAPLGPPGSWYANPGTWSSDVRGRRTAGRYPFVVVRVTASGTRNTSPGVEVELGHWHPRTGTVNPDTGA